MKLLILILSAGSLAAQVRPTQRPSPHPTQTTSGSSTVIETPTPRLGWSYDPDAGVVYRRGNFQWTVWGYGERVFRPAGNSFWRRVRQGMEFDLPRFTKNYRSAAVYEVDLTDTNFFRSSPKWDIFENLYWTLQNAEDPNKLRVVFGENTHILTYEDNLSSGNLPTINRSLILEEHGSVNSFGTQFGVQVQKALSPRYTVAVSAQDNRGSLNTPNPRYVIGNDLAFKITASLVNNSNNGQKFVIGAGIDHTRDLRNKTFTLISAIGAEPLGGAAVSGNKATFEAYGLYEGRWEKHPFSIDSEQMFSDFSHSGTTVGGGYILGQVSMFDKPDLGDLVPFFRYDFVRLGTHGVTGNAFQQAIRTGVNFNLPYCRKLADFHVEYARDSISGPSPIIPISHSFDELGLELRLNLTRYVRQ